VKDGSGKRGGGPCLHRVQKEKLLYYKKQAEKTSKIGAQEVLQVV